MPAEGFERRLLAELDDRAPRAAAPWLLFASGALVATAAAWCAPRGAAESLADGVSQRLRWPTTWRASAR
jgi:hypothetical protein